MPTSRADFRGYGFIALAAILMFSISPAVAQADFKPVYHPTIAITKTTSLIKIDGNLDDAEWKIASKADHFAENYPGDQTKPPVETEAFITYDDNHLYVAFVCHDDAATVRGSLNDRDTFGEDDNVGFFFDTYGEAAWAYILNVNPYGVQCDALWSRNVGEDSRYDLIWESAARITDSGYQVEMAIPFSSLRFPNKDVQTWKVDFWRNHPRESERSYTWAALDRNNPCWLCQWGTMTGLQNVKPGRGIEFLPSFVSFQSSSLEDSDNPDTTFKHEDIRGELSLGAKYAVSSNATAEATFNPDFSQVESDAAQIDVNTTFALNFPERRPFFQEGSDLFNTYLYSFYSRAINDPQAAAKFTGRFNRTSVAWLGAYDEHSPVTMPFEEFSRTVPDAGKSYSNIFRARRTLGEESHIGLMVTDRRFDVGGAGTFFSLDGAIRFLNNYRFTFQSAGSYTKEPDKPKLTEEIVEDIADPRFDSEKNTIAFDDESFTGHAVRAGLTRDGRHWGFSATYTELSPSFRTDLGRETKNNKREADLYAHYTFYPSTEIVERIQPILVLGRVWNFNKAKKDEWVTGEIEIQLKWQTAVGLSYLRSWERFRDKNFPGIVRYSVSCESDLSEFFGVGAGATWGHTIARQEHPILGNEVMLEAGAYIKPFDRLRIEPEYEYDKSEHPDSGRILFEEYVIRVRTTLQFTRELFLRLVVQYDDSDNRWEVDPLLTYRLNPFSLFYVGSTYDYNYFDSDADRRDRWSLSQRQYFLKLQYLIQL